MPNVHFKAFTLSNLEEGLFNFLHLKKNNEDIKKYINKSEPQSRKGNISTLTYTIQMQKPSVFEL